MPWTLYRYILKDLLKLLLLSTAVLMTVFAFAAAIKPLADGVLDPRAMPRFMMFIMPVVLPIALPFGGAFACTMVFSRMSADNEVLACRASGLSYYRILLPVYTCGVMLMVALFFLSHLIVPHFFREAEQMVQQDITRIVIERIESRRPVTLGKLVLYADRIAVNDDPPAPTGSADKPYRALQLEGVAAGQMSEADGGRLRSDATARSAVVALYRRQMDDFAVLRLHDAVVHNPANDQLIEVERVEFPPVRVPSLRKDDIRFYSRDELRALSLDPLLYDRVRMRIDRLAEEIAAEHVRQKVTDSLSGGKPLELRGSRDEETYELHAPAIEQTQEGVRLVGAQGRPILFVYRYGDQILRHIEAQTGILRFEPGAPNPQPQVRVELTDAAVTNLDPATNTPTGPAAQHGTLKLPAMSWPEPVLDRLRDMSPEQLSDLATTSYIDSGEVQRLEGLLQYEMIRLQRRIVSQMHERACMAIISLLAFLIAAVLAMRLKGAMPLAVFLLAFVLAFVAVIITRSGENMVIEQENPLLLGVLLTWAGVLLLTGMFIWHYRMLARN